MIHMYLYCGVWYKSLLDWNAWNYRVKNLLEWNPAVLELLWNMVEI